MDSRDIDITELVIPSTPKGIVLGIYTLQKELVDKYTKIEKLPAYPLAIDIKPNQVLLKDFSARVVEELGEFFESFLQKEDTNESHNMDEELADAIHFLVELLIFSGVTAEDFYDEIKNYPATVNTAEVESSTIVFPLWKITYRLQLARNCLKNKPWKQSEQLTDLTNYQNHLKGAIKGMSELWYALGYSLSYIYTIYYKKNKVNLFRISSKY